MNRSWWMRTISAPRPGRRAVVGIEVELAQPSRPSGRPSGRAGERAVVRRGDDRVGVVELELDAVVRLCSSSGMTASSKSSLKRAEVDRLDVGVPHRPGVVDDDALRALVGHGSTGPSSVTSVRVQAEDQVGVVDRAEPLAQLLERAGLAGRHRPRVVDDQLLGRLRLVATPGRPCRPSAREGGDDGDPIARVRGQPARADEASEDGAGVVAQRARRRPPAARRSARAPTRTTRRGPAAGRPATNSRAGRPSAPGMSSAADVLDADEHEPRPQAVRRSGSSASSSGAAGVRTHGRSGAPRCRRAGSSRTRRRRCRARDSGGRSASGRCPWRGRPGAARASRRPVVVD